MKQIFPLLLLAITMIVSPLRAQLADDSESAAPIGSTVITSDELRSDQLSHQSVFSGKVVVTGQNFRMTCQQMTVYFTNDNKVDKLVATGDVIITQPDRVTHCGHAEYFREADTFVLTDRPIILDHKSQVKGTRIDIDRKSQKMTVSGGRSTVVINDSTLGAPGASAPAESK